MDGAVQRYREVGLARIAPEGCGDGVKIGIARDQFDD
jgi:hypothetical protein